LLVNQAEVLNPGLECLTNKQTETIWGFTAETLSLFEYDVQIAKILSVKILVGTQIKCIFKMKNSQFIFQLVFMIYKLITRNQFSP
jgi:hypothetical protein